MDKSREGSGWRRSLSEMIDDLVRDTHIQPRTEAAPARVGPRKTKAPFRRAEVKRRRKAADRSRARNRKVRA